MDNRVLTGARARALKNTNRPLFWVRLFVLTLLLTFGVAIPLARSVAQAANQEGRASTANVTGPQQAYARNCPECWAAYQACLLGGDPGQCLSQYEACCH